MSSVRLQGLLSAYEHSRAVCFTSATQSTGISQHFKMLEDHLFRIHHWEHYESSFGPRDYPEFDELKFLWFQYLWTPLMSFITSDAVMTDILLVRPFYIFISVSVTVPVAEKNFAQLLFNNQWSVQSDLIRGKGMFILLRAHHSKEPNFMHHQWESDKHNLGTIAYFSLVEHLSSKLLINLAKCSCPTVPMMWLSEVLQVCSEFHTKLSL